MTYLPVAWATDDVITEVKLDQMVANEAHAQAERESTLIWTGEPYIVNTNNSNDGPLNIQFDGITRASFAAEGTHFSGNISMTGVTDGLTELTFMSDAISSDIYRFIKTANMVYMSVWLKYTVNYDGDFNISDVEIFGHYTTKTWTA